MEKARGGSRAIALETVRKKRNRKTGLGDQESGEKSHVGNHPERGTITGTRLV